MATDPDSYTADVVAQLQYWTKRKEALRSVNEYAKMQLPMDKQPTVGKIDIFLLEEMMVYSGHKDTDYVSDMVKRLSYHWCAPIWGVWN